MKYVEHILLKAINEIADYEASTDNGIPFIRNILSKVNIDYREAVIANLPAHNGKPIQWNKTEPPQDARECNDHPAVRNTDYMEVHHLTGTSGCSPHHPHWTWPVLGVIEDESSKQLVVPGDWIFEVSENKYVVMHAHQYEAIFGVRPARKLSKEELYNAGTQLFVNAGMDANEYLKKFEEGIGKLGLRGGDELTDKHIEHILMTLFTVDRADLVVAADTRAKINAADKLKVEQLHCK